MLQPVRCSSYEYGKVDHNAFNPRPDFVHQLDGSLLRSALSLGETDWQSGLGRCPSGDREKPKVLVGMVGSGDKVIDDRSADFFAAVEKVFPKLLAIEMEGAGAAAAIQEAQDEGKTVGFLMIRGISDMPRGTNSTVKKPAAESKQDIPAVSPRDQWKSYAAKAAATFTMCFVSQAWPIPPRSEDDLGDGGKPGMTQQDSGALSAGSNAATTGEATTDGVENVLLRLLLRSTRRMADLTLGNKDLSDIVVLQEAIVRTRRYSSWVMVLLFAMCTAEGVACRLLSSPHGVAAALAMLICILCFMYASLRILLRVLLSASAQGAGTGMLDAMLNIGPQTAAILAGVVLTSGKATGASLFIAVSGSVLSYTITDTVTDDRARPYVRGALARTAEPSVSGEPVVVPAHKAASGLAGEAGFAPEELTSVGSKDGSVCWFGAKPRRPFPDDSYSMFIESELTLLWEPHRAVGAVRLIREPDPRADPLGTAPREFLASKGTGQWVAAEPVRQRGERVRHIAAAEFMITQGASSHPYTMSHHR